MFVLVFSCRQSHTVTRTWSVSAEFSSPPFHARHDCDGSVGIRGRENDSWKVVYGRQLDWQQAQWVLCADTVGVVC